MISWGPPNDRVLASISINYSAGLDIAQWITNQDPDGDGVPDHVYGTLDRDVVDMFVVWDMSQVDYARPGQFSVFRDLGDAFGGSATNVLMVKASYWFNR